MQHVESFLKRFLHPPKGHSPEVIKAKLQHWIEVANAPEQFTEDKSAHMVSAIRKSARQCLKRLVERHPDLAAEFVREQEAA